MFCLNSDESISIKSTYKMNHENLTPHSYRICLAKSNSCLKLLLHFLQINKSEIVVAVCFDTICAFKFPLCLKFMKQTEH